MTDYSQTIIDLAYIVAAILFILGISKIWAGLSGGWEGFHAFRIGDRPMLLLGVLLIILGVLFVAMGLLAEIIVRTYYESQGKRVYRIRDIVASGQEQPNL